jgi:hypothetical protein
MQRMCQLCLLAAMVWASPVWADTLTFQQGVNGYTGAVDTYIDSTLGSQAGTTPMVVDGDPAEHVLVRFDGIFGTGASQIPTGASIISATLTLWVGSGTNDQSANPVNFHRLLHAWNATDVWAAYGVSPWNGSGGVQADGVDAVSVAEATSTMSTANQAYTVTVTASLQAWLAAPASNFGWVILPTGTDGLRLVSSEGTTANRPLLTVTFTPPCDGPEDCSDGDLCTTDTCEVGQCQHTAVSCPSGQVCDPGTGLCTAAPVTATFQEGVNGYAGTQDAHIQENAPTTNYGGAVTVKWDTDEPSSSAKYSYGLLRFDSVFGSGAGQVPAGVTINSATLTLYITNIIADAEAAASVNEVAVDWTESAVTWSNFGGTAGVQAEDYGTFLATVPRGPINTAVHIDVKASIQAWVNNPAGNRGWIVRPASTDGQECASSEATTQAQHPLLTIVYVAATPCTDAQDCNDGNPCTTDTCEDNLCVHTNNTDACDDGNACTINDACVNGTCSGTAKSCQAGQTCDPATGQCVGPLTLIGVNDTEWRYFKGTAEPTPGDQTAWTRVGFNQSAWAQGTSNGTYAGFGYDYYAETSGTNANGDYGPYVGTELSDMRYCTPTAPPLCNSPGYASVYLRREFTLPDPVSVTALTVKLYIDDGCVVYLNGTEVARSTSMGGTVGTPPAYNALATGGPASGDVPPVNNTFDLTSRIGLLVPGTNVLAIQAHNASLDSRDLLILAQLQATMPGNAAPNPPANPVPPDLATGVSANPTLSVTVTDAELDPLDVTFYGRESDGTGAADFTIVHVTDTQFYSESNPQGYQTMMQWVAANRATHNIVYLAHTGDITNVGTVSSQWVNADAAMDFLESESLTGLTGGLPYGILPGNHDGAPDATTLYNNYFGVTRYYGRSYYGGHYSTDNDNNYTLFSSGGMDFIAVNLEMQPSSAVLAWADALLKTYSNRRAIVTSHYIMEVGEQSAFGAPGQAIYDTLKNNANLFLMLCGHMHGEGKRYDDYQGRRVWTMIADYQEVDGGVGGWLRLLRFSPTNNKIYVQTYSPKTGTYRTGTSSAFELDYPMDGSGPFTALGTVLDVPSGDVASVNWPGRTVGKTYQWYATVSDGTSVTTGPMWSFTSGGSCTAPEDCNDADVCTIDACIDEVCTHTPIEGCCHSDGDCSDGNPCNGTETCVAGVCQPGTAVNCAHLDTACTAGVCDPYTGACTSEVINEGGNCDDELDCTIDDMCVAGVCSGTDNCPGQTVCNPATNACEQPTPTLSFQEGVDGYTGTVDTYLRQQEPSLAHGALDWIEWDASEGTSNMETVGLLRFDNIFGVNYGQIPVGAEVLAATVTLSIRDAGNAGTMRPVLVTWDESTTYDGFGGDAGVQADEYGAVTGSMSGSVGYQSVDVTANLQAWAADPATNLGWVILHTGSAGVEAYSSEAATSTERPKLTVTYRVQCHSDAECDDGNLCTTDTCIGGECAYENNALDCNDGNPCTTGDACSNGSCQGSAMDCGTGYSCNPATGGCEPILVAEALPIEVGDTWRYFKGSTAPPADWTALHFDDSAWLSGASGFGFGTDCSASRGTMLSDMQNSYVSIYTRRLFHVDDPDLISRLMLTVDYDDAFVAYINETEVARRNVVGTPPANTQLATEDHECSSCNGTCNAAEVIDLSEYISLLRDNTNILAVQGHNLTSGSSDFTLLVTLAATMAPACQEDSECDDHNACNGVETCVLNQCVLGTALNCDDGNACTDDSCDPLLGCVHDPNDAHACTDNDDCTTDVCVNGTCVGTPISCDDGIACTTDSCVTGGGCQHADACPSGYACNLSLGVCEQQNVPQTVTFQDGSAGYAGTVDTYIHEASPSTSYGTSATLRWDTEDPAPSRVYTLLRFEHLFRTDGGPIPAGATILSATLTYTVGGDSNAEGGNGDLRVALVDWSEATVYNDFGGDAGVQADEYGGTSVATLTASPAGTYSAAVLASLQAWSVDPASNRGWIVLPTTNNGVQVRASEYTTTPGERPKLTVTYLGAAGCDDASDCDDLNACTLDVCVDSLCQNTPVVCDDHNPCTDDTCDPQTGCHAVADDTNTCDDGNACTSADACVSGVCVGGPAPDCDDDNVCTIDACDTLSGCTHTALSCDDGIPCTDDTCDPQLGCQHTDNCASGEHCDSTLLACQPNAQLTGALTSATAAPGESVALDVRVQWAEHVRGYQTQIAIARTSGTGSLTASCPGGVQVDEGRADYLFHNLGPTYPATNCGELLASAALLNGGVTVGESSAYLATYTLTLSADATDGSTFEITILPSPGSRLYDDATSGYPRPIPFAVGSVSVVTVRVAAGDCYIGGTWYDAGAVNPANPCQVCDPGTSASAWSNAANGTPCSDGAYCTPTDTCQNGICVGAGSACTDACEACDEATDGCRHCIFDLARDGYGVIGGADFAIFAGDYAACYAAGDPRLRSDFDGNGCVGGSDFSVFSGCYASTCGQCQNCYPGTGTPRPDASDDAHAQLRLVAVSQPSPADVCAALPPSRTEFAPRETFYLELWASGEAAGAGLAAVYANLSYDPAQLRVETVQSGAQFGLFARGAVEPRTGTITALGGCAPLGEGTLGTNATWVRVAAVRVQGRATEAADGDAGPVDHRTRLSPRPGGLTLVQTHPAAAPFGVAIFGRFGDLSTGQVGYGQLKLRISSDVSGPVTPAGNEEVDEPLPN